MLNLLVIKKIKTSKIKFCSLSYIKKLFVQFMIIIFNRCGCGRLKIAHDNRALEESEKPNEKWNVDEHVAEDRQTDADGEIIFINNYDNNAKV